MTPILEVDNISKKYGAKLAVQGVSFSVEAGEVFGLLGPNGAGKTTLISMLTGVLEPSGGTARVDGHDILQESQAVRQLIGLVPQDLALYPTLSARANLEFFGRIYGLRGRELQARVDDVLGIVSLADRQKEAVEKFSGGMKRRVNIAAGLVHQPRLLFLDEPTVGVDPQSRNHIFESVLKLNRERGMSIIYTSHYMEEVETLCTRVAIVDDGRIVALDTLKNLLGLLGGGVIQVGLRQVDDSLLGQLAALPAVARVSLAPPAGDGPAPATADLRTLNIEARDGQQAVINVIGLLNAQGRQIASLEILEPNLESVFLHLTGKKLRE